MSDIEDFEATADSGASDTYPMQCSALRKNGFVVIKDRPCKIVEMSTSKTGKHGHAKPVTGHVLVQVIPHYCVYCMFVCYREMKGEEHMQVSKVHLVGIDMFTNKKYEDICPSTHNMNVPHVNRKEYMLNDINDGYLSLMDDSGNLREDLKLPNDDALKKDIETRFEKGEELMVSVLKSLKDEAVISCKASNDSSK